jgi:hypothetical protein
MSQPAIYTPATAMPEYFMKSLREKVMTAFSSFVFLLLMVPPCEFKRDGMHTDDFITLNRCAGLWKSIKVSI